MSETVSTTHKLFAYIPRTTAYYKSMPLVFTPVTDAIWLLCIGGGVVSRLCTAVCSLRCALAWLLFTLLFLIIMAFLSGGS